MGVVYRDKWGVEYESVPLPTHEVTAAVPLSARQVNKRAPAKKPLPFYEGTDGDQLAKQPAEHRRRWSDAQWVAFKEHQHAEAERAGEDAPIATAVVIKSGPSAEPRPPVPREEVAAPRH